MSSATIEAPKAKPSHRDLVNVAYPDENDRMRLATFLFSRGGSSFYRVNFYVSQHVKSSIIPENRIDESRFVEVTEAGRVIDRTSK